MAASYFFYDLETSGFSASAARIMQFAGQRTDENLVPVGEPVNALIKLAPDVLPDPDAIMLTGITPQATIQDGYSEAEFLKYFYDEVVQPDTTFLGYNSVRFDDEFMRYLHYRNFYDPYEWQWANGCSRWDILDLVRMTRALRPDGITWPLSDEGKPTNRLELLTKANNLDHYQAHDALSDVRATIAVARLIRDKQPDLYKYLFNGRSKKATSQLVLQAKPFVYTSGRYPNETLHTTVVVLLAKHPQQDCALVYDLRHDPTPFLQLSPAQLADAWRYKKDRQPTDLNLPVKTLKYNRCPAIAPLGVIKEATTQTRLQLPLATVTKHFETLRAAQAQFANNVLAAVKLLDDERASQSAATVLTSETVDAKLYDGFLAAGDKALLPKLRAADPDQLSGFTEHFADERLKQLLPVYKARNYPGALTSDERQAWEAHLAATLYEGGAGSRLASYFNRLQALASGTLTSEQEYLLAELQLYGESILPSDAG